MQQLTNTTLGRYEILEEIGAGAMGIVYRATDPLLERSVAIKTIRIDVTAAEREEFKKRFFREAKSAGKLNHPNIVTVYDAGESGNVAFIAMELLEGEDLRSHISLTVKIPYARSAEIIADVARALHYAHGEGVIHRDVKPGNIILLNNGIVKLADFGIARLASGSGTQTGQMFGTPKYMAPEQIAGRQADARTDIFSLGIVFYQLITGVAPFDGDSFSSIMFRVMQEPAVSPSDLVEGLPHGFEYVLSKALAKDPNNRYQTSAEMETDLRALASSEGHDMLPWGVGGLRSLAQNPASARELPMSWESTQFIDRPSDRASTNDGTVAVPSAVAAAVAAAANSQNVATMPLPDAAERARAAALVPMATPMSATLARDVEAQRNEGAAAALNSAAMATPATASGTTPIAAAGTAPITALVDAKPAVKSEPKPAAAPARSGSKADRKVKPSGKTPDVTEAVAPARSKLKLLLAGAAGVGAVAVAIFALKQPAGISPAGGVDLPQAAGSMPAVSASAAAATASATDVPTIVAVDPSSPASVVLPSIVSIVASEPDAAASVPAAPTEGRLAIAASPWGEVFVDGQSRGVTPPLTELKLPPGTYTVQIRNSEFPPFERRITIEAGKRSRITAKFK